MASNKEPLQVTVKGTAAFCHLYKPDTKFAKKGEAGKYKMSLVVDKADLPNLMAGINGGGERISGDDWIAMLIAKHEAAGGDAANCPIKDGDKPVDKKGKPKPVKEEFVGKYEIKFTSNFPAELIDTAKNDLPPKIKVMSGDTVKVAFRPNVYDEGMNFYMNSIMLIEKNSGGGGKSAFGDEEGFVADQTDRDAFGDDEGDDEAKSATGDY